MREIKDELEVPGEVTIYKSLKVVEVANEIKEIITKYQNQGKQTLNDIPEGEEKQHLRNLFTALGQRVAF